MPAIIEPIDDSPLAPPPSQPPALPQLPLPQTPYLGTDAGAAAGPAGNSTALITNPAGSPEQIAAAIQNNPFFQGTMADLNQWYEGTMAGYGLSEAALNQSSSAGSAAAAAAANAAKMRAQFEKEAIDLALKLAAEQDAFEKEKGLRAQEAKAGTLHEVLAARGMVGSGQQGVETGELQQAWSDFEKQMALALSGRTQEADLARRRTDAELQAQLAQASAAGAGARAGAAIARARLQLEKNDAIYKYKTETGGLYIKAYGEAMDEKSPFYVPGLAETSINLMWNPATGTYHDPKTGNHYQVAGEGADPVLIGQAPNVSMGQAVWTGSSWGTQVPWAGDEPGTESSLVLGLNPDGTPIYPTFGG